MLHIAKRPGEIDVQKLVELYDIKGEDAESFVDYIENRFFDIPGASYYIVEESASYISALRVEPYLDGFLISGLHTEKAHRRKGYATKLLRMVTDDLPGVVYSHILHKNIASVRAHSNCGFVKMIAYAKLLDGTVSSRYSTMKK